VTFDFTTTTSGGVTGFTPSATNLVKGDKIEDVLHNTTELPQTVTYRIVPLNASGCASSPALVVVTVLPTAGIDQVDDIVLCKGEISEEIVFSSPSSPGGDVEFIWTNSQPSIGLAAS
jgi:hypothetical protein